MTYNIYFIPNVAEPVIVNTTPNYNQEMVNKKLPKLTECEETF